MSNQDMAAAIASVDMFKALVDNEGTIWIRLRDGWSYLSSLTELSWDVRDILPPEYEPYRPLDTQATAMVHLALSLKAIC